MRSGMRSAIGSNDVRFLLLLYLLFCIYGSKCGFVFVAQIKQVKSETKVNVQNEHLSCGWLALIEYHLRRVVLHISLPDLMVWCTMGVG